MCSVEHIYLRPVKSSLDPTCNSLIHVHGSSDISTVMEELAPSLAYSQHAQILLADMGALGWSPDQLAGSQDVRRDALEYLTSFLRGDDPHHSLRYRQAARRVLNYLIEFSATAPTGEGGYSDEDHDRLKLGLAEILFTELGAPPSRYYE